MRAFFLIILWGSLLAMPKGFSQENSYQPIYPQRWVFPGIIVDGDTLPAITLPTLVVYPKRQLGNDRFSREYVSMAIKVLKVYPYARLAVEILDELKDTLATLAKDRAKRKFLNAYEKALFNQYKTDLTRLKVSEGRILLKLIDRETGRTSYELVEEYRGKFSAYFWQGIARLFGENLKVKYDPTGEDRLIEEIVRKIEAGQLEPMPIPQKLQKK